MARLPHPGGDSGNWGTLLNDFLSQVHASDGTLKTDSVTSDAIAPDAVTTSSIAPGAVDDTIIQDGSITNALIADGTIEETKLTSSVQSKLNQTAPVISVAGKTGDITLTQADIADLTTDLATKEPAVTASTTDKYYRGDKSWQTLNASAISDATVTGKALLTAVDADSVRTAIDAVDDFDIRLDDNRTPIDGSVTAAKLESSFAGTLVTLTGSQTLTNKTITTPKIAQIKDSNGNIIIDTTARGSAANYLAIGNNTASAYPDIQALGSDTNIGISLVPKGNGPIFIWNASNSTNTITSSGGVTNVGLNLTTKGTGVVQANGVEVVTLSGTQTLTNKTLTTPVIGSVKDSNGNTIIGTTATASAVNYVNFSNSVDTAPVVISAAGASTNISWYLDAKGAGSHIFRTSDGTVRLTLSGTGGTNYLQVSSGGTPSLLPVGSDTDIGLTIAPKGAGAVTIYEPSGQTATLRASGVDSNVDMDIRSKGTGVVKANGNPVANKVAVPATASSTGIVGQYAVDANYRYDCIATNTWVRSAVATW